MKKVTIMHLFTISVYLVLGIIIGIVIDKDWLTNEQMHFIQQLREENSLLLQEKQAWVGYVEDEINQIKIYAKADNEQFNDLKTILETVGVKLEELPETIGVYNQKGIIISLGEELDETNGLPQLMLENIPKHETDLTIMYLSLLKMKEELIDHESVN